MIYILEGHYLIHYSDEWPQACKLPDSDVTICNNFSHWTWPGRKQQESQEAVRGGGDEGGMVKTNWGPELRIFELRPITSFMIVREPLNLLVSCSTFTKWDLTAIMC